MATKFLMIDVEMIADDRRHRSGHRYIAWIQPIDGTL